MNDRFPKECRRNKNNNNYTNGHPTDLTAYSIPRSTGSTAQSQPPQYEQSIHSHTSQSDSVYCIRGNPAGPAA